MPLTKEEKATLELECAQAKFRARETWGTVQQLKEILNSYKKSHHRWCRRFEKADLQLAEDSKLTKYDVKGAQQDVGDGLHLLVKLDQSQLERIAEEIKKMEGGEEG